MTPIKLLLPALLLLAGGAEAATVIGLTATNSLVRFDSATPGTLIDGPIPITGLAGFEGILAIDYRPATGVLYGMSTSNRLFTINPFTGAATLVGTFTPFLSGSEFGFDFIPTADRIRVVSDFDQNLRLNPDSVSVVIDTPLAFDTGDLHFGTNPNITSIAYSSNYAGATSSTAFSIDTALDILVKYSNPNGGKLQTVGALGVGTTSLAGFDIDPPTGVAFAALETSMGQSSLYVVNLATGPATLIGLIGTELRIRGIAIMPVASVMVGLTTTNGLVRFNANAPDIIVGPVAILGLSAGEDILAIDYRPANGQLYGLSSLSRLFKLDATTGDATLAATMSSSLAGTSFGFDFNPTTDRARVVSNTGQSVRVNPDTGVVLTDTPLVFADVDPNHGVPPSVTGSSYINSVFGATTSLLYGIDTSLDVLVTQNPPILGVLNTVGGLGVDAVGEIGFDIEPVMNTGWAAMVVGGVSGLYAIDLHSAAAKLIGNIGGGNQLRGLAVVLFGASPPATVTATGAGVQVTVSYSAVTGADHYDVYRRDAGGSFVIAGSSIGLQFQDTGVAANTWYLYKVRAVGPGGNAAPDSAVDVATTMVFTEDPPTVGVTTIKAVHLTELRTGVNAVRALAGLASASLTDPLLTGINIKVVHITELRAALDAARAALGAPAVTYSRTLTPGVTLIASIDFIELRTGIR